MVCELHILEGGVVLEVNKYSECKHNCSLVMIRMIFFTMVFLNVYIASNSQDSNRIFYLGHSLINHQTPRMTDQLAKDAKAKTFYQAHIGNGANFSWHWTHPETGEGNQWDTTLRNQTFETFVLTEAVPLKGQLKWSNTYEYLDSFYQYAVQKSPNINVYIYETWHCINSGTPIGCMYDDDKHIPWRDRLDIDLSLWEGIAESHNAKYSNKAYIIPGGQGLARLHDAILAGQVLGLTDIRQLFSDDIHLTSVGNYFIACIMYATIFKKSPEGLTHQITDMYGQVYTPAPTLEMAKIMQKIAWQTVCAYNRTNVNCTTNIEDNPEAFVVGSKVSHDYIQLETVVDQIQILNLEGKALAMCNHCDHILTSDFPSGIYFAKIRAGMQTALIKYFKI